MFSENVGESNPFQLELLWDCLCKLTQEKTNICVCFPKITGTETDCYQVKCFESRRPMGLILLYLNKFIDLHTFK